MTGNAQAPAPRGAIATRPQTERGLATVGGFSARDLTENLDKLAQLREVAIVPFPPTYFDSMPPYLRPVINIERIDPDPAKGDVYKPSQGGGKVALHKHALDRIAAAAGINWVPERSGRRGDPRDIDHIIVVAVGVLRHPSSELRTVYGEAEWEYSKTLDKNMRSGAKNYQGQALEDYAKKRTLEEREYALERTESRAKNRAVRQAIALKGAYDQTELAKPIIIPGVTLNYEYDDPDFKAAIRQQALGATNALYGPQPPLVALPPPMEKLAVPDDDDDDDASAGSARAEDPEPVTIPGRQPGPFEARARQGLAPAPVQEETGPIYDPFADDGPAPGSGQAEDPRMASLIALGQEVGVDANKLVALVAKAFPQTGGDLGKLTDEQYREAIAGLERRRVAA